MVGGLPLDGVDITCFAHACRVCVMLHLHMLHLHSTRACHPTWFYLFAIHNAGILVYLLPTYVMRARVYVSDIYS